MSLLFCPPDIPKNESKELKVRWNHKDKENSLGDEYNKMLAAGKQDAS